MVDHTQGLESDPLHPKYIKSTGMDRKERLVLSGVTCLTNASVTKLRTEARVGVERAQRDNAFKTLLKSVL